MKITVSRALFGILLGVAGGICFGIIARSVAGNIIRTEYNSVYYEEYGSVVELGVAIAGLIAGILVPLVNKRLLRVAIGGGVWALGTFIFLLLPPVFITLLVPGAMIVACSVISALGGVILGGIAAWVDLP